MKKTLLSLFLFLSALPFARAQLISHTLVDKPLVRAYYTYYYKQIVQAVDENNRQGRLAVFKDRALKEKITPAEVSSYLQAQVGASGNAGKASVFPVDSFTGMQDLPWNARDKKNLPAAVSFFASTPKGEQPVLYVYADTLQGVLSPELRWILKRIMDVQMAGYSGKPILKADLQRIADQELHALALRLYRPAHGGLTKMYKNDSLESFYSAAEVDEMMQYCLPPNGKKGLDCRTLSQDSLPGYYLMEEHVVRDGVYTTRLRGAGPARYVVQRDGTLKPAFVFYMDGITVPFYLNGEHQKLFYNLNAFVKSRLIDVEYRKQFPQ